MTNPVLVVVALALAVAVTAVEESHDLSAGSLHAASPSQQFSAWEKQREHDMTDRELSVLNEVSAHVATRAEQKHAALERTQQRVDSLGKQIEEKGELVDEKLNDAKDSENGARRATIRAERAVVEEKYSSDPLTEEQESNVKMGERIALTEEESTPREAHKQAERVARLEGDVRTRLHEYTTKFALRLAQPFGDRKAHQKKLSKLRGQFGNEVKHEAGQQVAAIKKLKQELDKLKPQLSALNDDEHESRLLRLQYQVVSQKMKQLKMLNKAGNYHTVEHHQAQLTAMGHHAVKQMKHQLDSFEARLAETARAERKAEEGPD